MDINQYLKERKKWKRAGKPLRSSKEISDIHEICRACPHFLEQQGFIKGYDKCGKCQCNLHISDTKLNKIAWGTTHCPDDPPRWDAQEVSEDDSGEV